MEYFKNNFKSVSNPELKSNITAPIWPKNQISGATGIAKWSAFKVSVIAPEIEPNIGILIAPKANGLSAIPTLSSPSTEGIFITLSQSSPAIFANTNIKDICIRTVSYTHLTLPTNREV